MLSLILVPAPEAAAVGLPLQVRMTKVGQTTLPLFEPAPGTDPDGWTHANTGES